MFIYIFFYLSGDQNCIDLFLKKKKQYDFIHDE